MNYLSKSDEKNFFDLLSTSEMVLDDIFESLLTIKNQKHEVLNKLDMQKKEVLSSLGEYPKTIDELPTNIYILRENGFYFDVNILLVKLYSIYSQGTILKNKFDSKRFIRIGSLYYDGNMEAFKEEMKELFKEIKVSINNVINRESVIVFRTSDKDIEHLIRNRQDVNWLIRNMEAFIKVYTTPVNEDILSYFNQDKVLLLLAHLNVSAITENILKDKKISDKSIRFCKIYAAYVKHRRKENPNYNPAYNYVEPATGKVSLISSDALLSQSIVFCENLEDFGSDYSVTLEELLEFLPDLKRDIKIKEFRKEIELSWEFLPEKEKADTDMKKMPLFKNYKTEEEKKIFENRKDELLEEKIALFASLPYITSLKGMNHFEGYIAYIFENGRVILEKFYKKTKSGLEPTFNEAIYVMDIDDFKELSKMGKTEIRQYAKETGLNVRIINHTKSFKQRVFDEVNKVSYTEDVLNFVDELVASAKKPMEKTL